MSLKDQLNQCSVDFESKQPDMAKVFCQFINELEDSGLIYDILKEGDAVPDFTLANISGDEVSLEQLLTKQKLIITFYRGGWCPYCNLELLAWQGVYDKLLEKNTEFVAISPEKAESMSLSGLSKDLTFETLYDKDNVVARKLGLVFEVNPM
jgi:peroxiredoxin